MNIGEKIQELRRAAGMSQEALGQKMFVTRQTVSLWEKGQTLPSLDNIIRLSEIFGISVDELVSGKPHTAALKTASEGLPETKAVKDTSDRSAADSASEEGTQAVSAPADSDRESSDTVIDRDAKDAIAPADASGERAKCCKCKRK